MSGPNRQKLIFLSLVIYGLITSITLVYLGWQSLRTYYLNSGFVSGQEYTVNYFVEYLTDSQCQELEIASREKKVQVVAADCNNLSGDIE